ncbi:hypothetical protein [Bradyrhizobium sp. SYSU BS000235]|uniref:hypothetical protein n=1 Tax=Bradyrhizobium sp. SYSU BS000235 TaxID=3411332 RepID=UPI003C75D9CD
MDGQRHTQTGPEDTPEQAQVRARMFLILSPVAFVVCWIVARTQDVSNQEALILAGALFVMCLFFSLYQWLRGERAAGDVFWLHMIFHFFRRDNHSD